MSFDASEVSVEAFNRGDETVRHSVVATTDLFLEFAFAGIPEECRPQFWWAPIPTRVVWKSTSQCRGLS